MTTTRLLQPLGRRLPLLIILLLSVVVAGVSWSAYLQIRRATLDASEAHLETSARRIAALLDSSARRSRLDVAPLAANPAIIAALRAPLRQADADVVSSLDSARQRAPRFAAVSVWTRDGTRIAVSGSDRLARAIGADVVRSARQGVRASPLILVADTLAYAVMLPVTTPSKDTLGYVVATRLIDGGVSGAANQLVGPGARLRIGNANGDLWTNLDSAVQGPPMTALRGRRGFFTADEERYVGANANVPGAPWIVWLDEVESLPLATARRFLAEVVAAGLVFVLAGAIGAWSIIRRVTDRLEEVRRAAEAVASGAPPSHVSDGGGDELSDLARSFNTMAERVSATNRQLMDRAATLEQRNQALRESEARYRQLVDQSPDAVLVHRDGTIVFANAVAVRLVGASDAAQLIGTSIFDLVDVPQRDAARERVDAIQASQQASMLTELELRRLDGTTFVAEVSGTPVVLDGVACVQTLARDVTERKSLEAQLRQSQKMEAVGRLAGGIAHDFNNLLTIINTYAELTLTQLPAGAPLRADVDAIRQAGMSAAKLTRQMLAFSRKQVLAPRMLDINDAITGLTGMLHRMLGEQITVETELRTGLGPIMADSGQLEQVLMNLAVNARDAMPDGGTLRIETDEVSLSEGYPGHHREIPAGDYIVLAVSDTGAGMSPHVKEHLFEPFFTTKQPGQGTGLGLATVYGIVKQSGGYIWVYSELQHGTTFKIYLPRYTGSDAALPAQTGEFQVPQRQAATILLVEDDASVRRVIRRILDKSPHEVHEADSGAQALELFRARDGRFDLVITDMVMPNMTGPELIHGLRERKPALRAIIMSGYSEEATTRDWRLPPNSAFLEKPLSPARLLRMVEEVLGAA